MQYSRVVLTAALQLAALLSPFLGPPPVFAEPCPIPNALPNTGAGGGSNCWASLDGCGGQAGQAMSSSGSVVAFVGSAPGPHHGSLVYLAVPVTRSQAVGCGTQNPPSQPAPSPVPGAGSNGGNNSGGAGPGGGSSGLPSDGSLPAAPAPIPCPPPPAPPALPDPRTVAQGIAIPWPDLQIRAKPDTIGLDGLPSWFWIEGYTGQPLIATTHVHLDGLLNSQPGCPGGPSADMDVGVRASPLGYEWQFGDHVPGSNLATTSLGVPYPQPEGAIQHQYETTSVGSGHPDGFTVNVTAHFGVQYQTEGGWQPLTETDRQAILAYKVQQVYPVIVHS